MLRLKMLVQDSKVVFWIVEKWKVAAVFNREHLSAGIAADDKVHAGTKNIIVNESHGNRKNRMF